MPCIGKFFFDSTLLYDPSNNNSLLALGSWAGTRPKEQARAFTWLLTGLQAGYRHIDTAALYGTLYY